MLLANGILQNLLEKNITVSQRFLGIGSGTDVATSGEGEVFELLHRTHKPPYCVFDVGSNRGQFLNMALERIAGKAAVFHCFEPGEETFSTLSNNYQSHRDVVLNKCAIGNCDADRILFYDEAGSGLASLTRRRLDHFGIQFDKSETVKVRTIDSYCLEHSIDFIHLLKLDVEGHELDALSGARGMFEREAIDIVTFEFGGCNIDTRSYFQDFWYFFLGLNMRLYRCTPSGYLLPISSYKETDEQFRTTNFIAVRSPLAIETYPNL